MAPPGAGVRAASPLLAVSEIVARSQSLVVGHITRSSASSYLSYLELISDRSAWRYGTSARGMSVEYSSDDKPDVAGVLADRLAATLVHHEPGWRLPTPSALAPRYYFLPAQDYQSVSGLQARHP